MPGRFHWHPITHMKAGNVAELVANGLIFLLLTWVSSMLLDVAVRPRRTIRWWWRGICLHLLVMTMVFGLLLAASGNPLVAGILSISLMTLFTLTSNAKHAMLGEPLLFSDLALIAALVRHPRFYFTAVSARQRRMLAIGAPTLSLLLAFLFVPQFAPHVAGLGLSALAAGVLALLLRSRGFRRLAMTPDVDVDLARYGLSSTLLLYWLRWRATADPPVCPPLRLPGRTSGDPPEASPPELIVVVQCESFADPVELTGQNGSALPGLNRARASAWQWGDLAVSGFGAYTMRTEYGVLFGRSEAALGFRRYDPFLTAHGETSYALSTRLRQGGYHNMFVHPHDMRFYGRDRLMPAIGFDRLIGEGSFAPIPPNGGRYVDDRTLGASIGELIDAAAGPTLIYAVTMENHGPWARDRLTGSLGGLEAYLRHLNSSDMMMTALIERLSRAGRPALLVFFGDHRPSIPGVTEPGGARHTPYVMLRFADGGGIVTGQNRRVDLSPDELHHAILRCAQSASQPGMMPEGMDILNLSGG